jgi:hypothetical protein
MRSLLCLALICSATPVFAQEKSVPGDLTINVNGKPYSVFHLGGDANKPFVAPLRTASGKIITRGFPMENIPGESRDHLHHRGMWFSYDDVNGIKFWENDPSYTKPGIGRIAVIQSSVKDTKGNSTVTAKLEWVNPDKHVLLIEDREMTFSGDDKLRIIDLKVTLTAAQPVTFGDTKEGAFAIRLSDAFTERKGCKIVDADGRTRMVNVWGKRSNWVDYSADVDGETVGVAIFDHPSNLNHPTYWHARDYGLFALDPFGQHAFDPKEPVRETKLAKEQQLVYRWRVVIHPGDAESGHMADLYKEYAAK